MMDFKAKDGIEIRIKRSIKPKAGSRVRQRPKGILTPRRKDDKRGRRLPGGLINFYDLGQIKISGEWATNPFFIAPTVEGVPLDGPFIRVLNAGDYTARDAELLEGGVGSLAGTYRKIARLHGDVFRLKVSGTGFSVTMTSSEEKWTDKGLELTADELSSDNFKVVGTIGDFDTNIYFPTITLTGSSKDKITSVFGNSAPAVEFSPKASDTYFLMPSFVQPTGNTRFNFTGPPENDTYNYDIGFTYQFCPRFPDDPDKIIEASGIINLGDLIAAWTLLVAQPSVKAYRSPQIGGDPYLSVSPGSTMPNELGGSGISYSPGFALLGTLLAIIKQGSNTFYVWRA